MPSTNSPSPCSAAVLTTVVVLGLGAGRAGAQPWVTYDASLGTLPQEQCFGLFTSGAPGAPTLPGGGVRIVSTGAQQIGWYRGDVPIDFAAGVRFGAEVKVNSCGAAVGSPPQPAWLRSGYMFSIADLQGRMAEFQLSVGGVYLTRDFYAAVSPGDYLFWPMTTTDAFHVYEVTVGGGTISLSVDSVMRLTFAEYGRTLAGLGDNGGWWWGDQSGHPWTDGDTLTRRLWLSGTGPGPITGVTGPGSTSICPTGAANFSVSVAGTGPFTYQWQWQPAPGAPWIDVVDGLNTDPQGGPNQFMGQDARTGTVRLENTGGSGTAQSHWDGRCIVTNACGSVTSNQATYTICPADFNCSGGQPTVQDLFDFLAAWFAKTPSADFNGSGGLPTVQDLFDFLSAWFARC